MNLITFHQACIGGAGLMEIVSCRIMMISLITEDVMAWIQHQSVLQGGELTDGRN